jgi:hypothetical protein
LCPIKEKLLVRGEDREDTLFMTTIVNAWTIIVRDGVDCQENTL